MRRRLAGILCTVVAVVALLGTLGCKSEADGVKDIVSKQLDAYTAFALGEEPKEGEPQPVFDDDDTAQVLSGYGIDVDEYHRHLYKNFSYKIDDATVDGDSATVSVDVTNASLDAALSAASADYSAWQETDEAQSAYADMGHQALLEELMQFLYQHLDANESPETTTVDIHLSKADNGAWQITR